MAMTGARRACHRPRAEYLRSATEARGIVLQIAPENGRLIRVAEKAGLAEVNASLAPKK